MTDIEIIQHLVSMTENNSIIWTLDDCTASLKVEDNTISFRQWYASHSEGGSNLYLYLNDELIIDSRVSFLKNLNHVYEPSKILYDAMLLLWTKIKMQHDSIKESTPKENRSKLEAIIKFLLCNTQ